MHDTHRMNNAAIEWLDNGLPYSPLYGDIYHSQYREQGATAEDGGALEESDQVFVLASELKQRWAAQHGRHDRSFLVAELGFGCGINFLRTWQHWRDFRNPQGQLYYIGIENAPLRREDLRRVLGHWPQFAEFAALLLERYDDHSRGLHRIHFPGERLTLDLCFEDAEQYLSRRDPALHAAVDCWYLDGFSPSKNPEMWSSRLLQHVSRNSREGTTLNTYSVAAAVRKPLSEHGFEVSKKPGFANKRHRLSAIYRRDEGGGLRLNWTRKNKPAAWLGCPAKGLEAKSPVLVVGAGLAGCSTARALAEKGYPVTIIDSAKCPASVGSANPQATLHLSLRRSVTAESEFYLQGYLFARRQFHDFAERGELDWHPCGVLQTSTALNSRKTFALADYLQSYAHAVVQASADESRSLAIAQHLQDPALYLPLSGWLSIPELCHAYLQSSLIDTRYESRLLKLTARGSSWVADIENAESTTYSAVVLANSVAIRQMNQVKDLPLAQSWGQVTQIEEILDSPFSMKEAPVICGSKTLSPAKNGRQTLSASYHDEQDEESAGRANSENIEGVSRLFADPILRHKTAGLQALDWINAYRGSSEDFNPIVGAVVDVDHTSELYRDLHRAGLQSRQLQDTEPRHHPGLYCNVGHGSHGLSSCPLSADFLACLISGEPAAISSAQAAMLSPSRFLLRSLRRRAPAVTG